MKCPQQQLRACSSLLNSPLLGNCRPRPAATPQSLLSNIQHSLKDEGLGWADSHLIVNVNKYKLTAVPTWTTSYISSCFQHTAFGFSSVTKMKLKAIKINKKHNNNLSVCSSVSVHQTVGSFSTRCRLVSEKKYNSVCITREKLQFCTLQLFILWCNDLCAETNHKSHCTFLRKHNFPQRNTDMNHPTFF